MRLLSVFRQLLQLPRLPATSAPLPGSEPVDTSDELEALSALFRQQLLTAVARSFPALEPTLAQEAIVLSMADITLQASAFSLTRHPDVQVGGFSVVLYHPRYFPTGLADNFVGFGTDEVDTSANGARVYVEGVLPTVLEALEGCYDPGLDLYMIDGGTHWHTITGPLQLQGAWTPRRHELPFAYWVRQLQPLLPEHLQEQPFHWIKLYASRQADGEFIGECRLDNQPWQAGLQVIERDVASWPADGEFAGIKQFMLFRRCGLAHGRE